MKGNFHVRFLRGEAAVTPSSLPGRLASCVYNGNTSTFGYGADGLRHRETVNGTVTDYAIDGQDAVRELKAGVSQATYLTGMTGPCYRRDDIAGTIRWYLYDGLGSVLGEVDPNGTITATRKYDVYGAVRSSTGTSTSKHKFVGSLGHPSEDETGLIYMRARYMDPVTGRFISEDPSRHGLSWYVYARNNPARLCDPDGKEDQLDALYYAWALVSMAVILALAGAGPFSGVASVAIMAAMVAALQQFNFALDGRVSPGDRQAGFWAAGLAGTTATRIFGAVFTEELKQMGPLAQACPVAIGAIVGMVGYGLECEAAINLID
jgi:RHS repeat-associated protein